MADLPLRALNSVDSVSSFGAPTKRERGTVGRQNSRLPSQSQRARCKLDHRTESRWSTNATVGAHGR